jgi:hypothetical protein
MDDESAIDRGCYLDMKALFILRPIYFSINLEGISPNVPTAYDVGAEAWRRNEAIARVANGGEA